MPIRIKCPKCQTILGVKDSLAGKKASCPKCRCMLTIPAGKAPAVKAPAPAAPAPNGPSQEDLDDLAHSAFADEPVKPAPVLTQMSFECPWCMEMVSVSTELAGKQTPCPNQECKRIVKVPLLKEDKPKDWRQVNPRSAAAAGLLKGDGTTDTAEGAWSSSQKTRVSTDSLLEANAIVVKKKPLTAGQWIKRGVAGVAGLVALVFGIWGISSWMGGNFLDGPLNAALAVADPGDEKPHELAPAAEADIFRGAGECYVLRNRAADALVHLKKARAKWSLPGDNMEPDAERDLVLIDIALTFVDLAGSQAEVDAETRKDWGDIAGELQRTLNMLSSTEAKQTAMRELSTKLIAKNQTELAVNLAKQMVPPPPPKVEQMPTPIDPFPVAKDEKPPDGEVKKEVQGNQQKLPPVEKKKEPPPVVRSPLEASWIALLIGTGSAAEAGKIVPAPALKDDEAIDPVARLGYAEGNARLGNFKLAHDIASHNPVLGLHRLESSIAVAAVALSQNKLAEAKTSATEALKGYQEFKIETPPAWLVIQLTKVCAGAGLTADVKKHVTDKLTGPKNKAIKALAQLALLKADLEANHGTRVSATHMDGFVTDKGTLGYSLALEYVARHNTRLGGRSDALGMLQGLSEEQQAFVQIGIALGLHEAK